MDGRTVDEMIRSPVDPLTRRGALGLLAGVALSDLARFGHNDNPCAGGAFKSPNQTRSFIDAGLDFVFTTFVTS